MPTRQQGLAAKAIQPCFQCGVTTNLVYLTERRGYRCRFCNRVFCARCGWDHFGGDNFKKENGVARLTREPMVGA